MRVKIALVCLAFAAVWRLAGPVPGRQDSEAGPRVIPYTLEAAGRVSAAVYDAK